MILCGKLFLFTTGRLITVTNTSQQSLDKPTVARQSCDILRGGENNQRIHAVLSRFSRKTMQRFQEPCDTVGTDVLRQGICLHCYLKDDGTVSSRRRLPSPLWNEHVRATADRRSHRTKISHATGQQIAISGDVRCCRRRSWDNLEYTYHKILFVEVVQVVC